MSVLLLAFKRVVATLLLPTEWGARRYIRTRLRIATAILLSVEWGVAWAALDTVWPRLTDWPWLQIAIGCLVSVAGGWTQFLMRYSSAMYDGRDFYVRREFVAATVYSIAAGMAAYFLAASFNGSSGGHEAMVGLVLLGAGFSAQPFLTALGERVVSLVRNERNKLGGD